MNVRSTAVLTFALTGLWLCQACDLSEPDGLQDPMKWQTEVVYQKDANGMSYVDVPGEGGTFKFTCLNYKGFWINYVVQIENGKETYYDNTLYTEADTTAATNTFHATLSTPWAEANSDSETGCLTVTVQPNDSTARKFYVAVESGDAFYTFPFRQRAKN